MTVKELSYRTGIIKGSLDNYLGQRSSIPPADVAVRIARALGVSVEYLVTGQSEQKRNNTPALHNDILDELNSIPSNARTAIKTLIHETAKITHQG